jgi:hypothetical protein
MWPWSPPQISRTLAGKRRYGIAPPIKRSITDDHSGNPHIGIIGYRHPRRGHDRDAKFATVFAAVLTAAGIRVIRSAVQAQRMNSIMERWIGSCRRELQDRTLIWNQRRLMIVLREYEDLYDLHRPHRALDQAAPLRPPDGVTDLDHFLVQFTGRRGGGTGR